MIQTTRQPQVHRPLLVSKRLLLALIVTMSMLKIAPMTAHAALTPPCGGLEMVNLYHFTLPAPDSPTNSDPNSYQYEVVALMKNYLPFSRGFRLAIPSQAANSNTVRFESLPTLAPKTSETFYVHISITTQPINGLPYRQSPGAVSIWTSPIRNEIQYTMCEVPHPLDVLFESHAGRDYTLQRSTDLRKWENIETIQHDLYQAHVWRPFSYLQSPQKPAREYYRIDVNCEGELDCKEQVTHLQHSRKQLKGQYGVNPPG